MEITPMRLPTAPEDIKLKSVSRPRAVPQVELKRPIMPLSRNVLGKRNEW